MTGGIDFQLRDRLDSGTGWKVLQEETPGTASHSRARDAPE